MNSQTTHLLLPLLPSFFSLYLFSLALCSNFEYLLWALKFLFFFFLLHSVQFSPIYLLVYFVSFIIKPMLMFWFLKKLLILENFKILQTYTYTNIERRIWWMPTPPSPSFNNCLFSSILPHIQVLLRRKSDNFQNCFCTHFCLSLIVIPWPLLVCSPSRRFCQSLGYSEERMRNYNIARQREEADFRGLWSYSLSWESPGTVINLWWECGSDLCHMSSVLLSSWGHSSGFMTCGSRSWSS